MSHTVSLRRGHGDFTYWAWLAKASCSLIPVEALGRNSHAKKIKYENTI